MKSEKPLIDYPPVDEPPFWGQGQMLVWDAATLCDVHDRSALYKNYWNGVLSPGSDHGNTVTESFNRLYEKLAQEIVEKGLVDARGYCGYFPVITDEETVIVLDPDDFRTERAALKYPRAEEMKKHSVADFIRPEGDFIAIQIVSLGRSIGEWCRTPGPADDQERGLYRNGIAGFLTAELEGKLTGEIRRGLFLPAGQGRCFGFGAPGLPPPEDRAKLFELMSIEDRMGIELTAGSAMDPEFSSLAVFIRHPQAEDY